MATFFLMVIYVAFIGLGLPDSALGASWPAMHQSLGIPIEYAGILSVMTTGGTILSSFMSGRVTRRFGTGKVTLISVLMTALALMGFSLAPGFYWLVLLTLPLGLGAGSVDAALNGYVSLHYEAKHMSWLHSFWGVGATTGPMILSFFLLSSSGWRSGYRVISAIQIGIVVLLFVTLPLWKRFDLKNISEREEDPEPPQAGGNIYRMKGVRYAILSFFAYCAVEMTMGLWGSSYLVNYSGFSAETAARYTSLYFGGITMGRFLTGFVTMKFSFRSIIRGGILSILLGILLILSGVSFLLFPGFLLVGFGCAPVFPGMIHETPARFGKAHAQTIIGAQMAFAYMGSTFMPALFGFLAGRGYLWLFTPYLLILLALLLFSTEKINAMMKKRNTLLQQHEKIVS
ncbi:MFS transporter [Proteiniclasticum sp. C24MP]|uniref:MFS transporter n=1 Tax=Proteiniclasticum sp. C24MP TaxID=3374101 RepID=UPI0037554166